MLSMQSTLFMQGAQANRDRAEEKCCSHLYRHVCGVHQAPSDLECCTLGPCCLVSHALDTLLHARPKFVCCLRHICV